MMGSKLILSFIYANQSLLFSFADKLSKPLHDILGNLTLIYKESNGSAAKLQLLPVLEYLLQLMDSLERYLFA